MLDVHDETYNDFIHICNLIFVLLSQPKCTPQFKCIARKPPLQTYTKEKELEIVIKLRSVKIVLRVARHPPGSKQSICVYLYALFCCCNLSVDTAIGINLSKMSIQICTRRIPAESDDQDPKRKK